MSEPERQQPSGNSTITVPTFHGRYDGTSSIREGSARGWGLAGWCMNCGLIVRRTTDEMIDRFWRQIDLTYRDIGVHLKCIECGSKALSLWCYDSGGMRLGAHNAGELVAGRLGEIEAELQRRKAAEAP